MSGGVQYVVHIDRGYVESSDVPNLVWYVIADATEPPTPKDLAENFRQVLGAATDAHNQEIDRLNAYREEWIKKDPQSYTARTKAGVHLSVAEYLDLLFTINMNEFQEWDWFEQNGWVVRASAVKITKVIYFDAFRSFVDPDEEGRSSDEWWCKHHIEVIEIP